MSSRRSRWAGRTIVAHASSTPAAADTEPHTTAWSGVAPKLAFPNAMRPARNAPMSPSAAPLIPTMTASIVASRRIRRGAAPRMRRSACSLRRRSRPDAATAAVRAAASTMPGMPRKRNSSCAYVASARAASSCAPRLSPTRPPPASAASRFFARASTSANAALGSEGRAGERLTWICRETPFVPGAEKRCRHVACGSSITLSGGAVGADPGAAPIDWNRESAAG